MLDILFQIIINPIYVLIEFLYNFFFKVCHFNQTLSIIALSITVNFLWLPLYLHADKLKLADDRIKEKLKKKIETIKKNFKGEECHLLLTTYYRQNNYHPVYSLRSFLSLILQMMFFVGAYLFFIKNIDSAPDGFLKILDYRINIAPIIMTIISIVSGITYLKNHRTSKLQIYILPLLFLILLYNAPFALVLYWIINNIFSLIKNQIQLRQRPKEESIKKYRIIDSIGFFKKGINWITSFLKKNNTDKSDLTSCYYLVCFCLWLLVGLLASWNVVASAPVKFFDIYPYHTPFPILFYNLVKTFGIFVFWGWVVFIFTPKEKRNLLSAFSIILFYFSLINYLIIEYPRGEVTNALEFTNYVDFQILSFDYYLAFFTIIPVVCILLLKKRSLIKRSLIIFIIVAFICGFYDAKRIIAMEQKIPKQSNVVEPFYNFSKTKKNILIIFIDKAIGNYFPLLLEESPQLKEYFKGFTFYPNTISFACFTRLAYPALIAGYEYTPLGLDLDRKKSMHDKYNEALLVLPKIFLNNGYKTTVTDAPWGDFEFITPKELFLKEGIKYDNLAGKYSNLYKEKYSFKKDKSALLALRRNLLYFSFMKISPIFLRSFIIDENSYLNLKKEEIKYTNDLLAHYSLMHYLPQLTEFKEDKPTFTIINSELTHNADCFLTYPDYTLTFKPVVKTPIKVNRYSAIHYHSNAAGIRLVAQYLEFLKNNGIYDNTRIIIISDHGAKRLENPYLDKKLEDNITRFNPLLLVKDFNDKGELKTSNEFMTNADLASLAFNNVINNPKNPYTNKEMRMEKDKPLVLVKITKRFVLKDKAKTPFNKQTQCVTVKDDIFKKENWKRIKPKKLDKIRKDQQNTK